MLALPNASSGTHECTLFKSRLVRARIVTRGWPPFTSETATLSTQSVVTPVRTRSSVESALPSSIISAVSGPAGSSFGGASGSAAQPTKSSNQAHDFTRTRMQLDYGA